MASGSDELERTVASACEHAGVELVDLEIVGASLQVTVERVGGLDLDEIAEAARAVSDALDDREDLTPAGRYELEVTSPGVERRLRRPPHFLRAIGSVVALRTAPGVAGERRLEGTLRDADEEGFTLLLDGGETRRFVYGDVERARTVFDWKAALRAHSAQSEIPPRSHTGAVATQRDGEAPA